jgi:hypothetical protein
MDVKKFFADLFAMSKKPTEPPPRHQLWTPMQSLKPAGMRDEKITLLRGTKSTG